MVKATYTFGVYNGIHYVPLLGEICARVGTCFYWTYDTTTLYCHMSRSDHGVHYRENVISGARGCTQQNGKVSSPFWECLNNLTLHCQECDADWSVFDKSCYMSLNNNNQLYSNIGVCRWDFPVPSSCCPAQGRVFLPGRQTGKYSLQGRKWFRHQPCEADQV